MQYAYVLYCNWKQKLFLVNVNCDILLFEILLPSLHNTLKKYLLLEAVFSIECVVAEIFSLFVLKQSFIKQNT